MKSTLRLSLLLTMALLFAACSSGDAADSAAADAGESADADSGGDAGGADLGPGPSSLDLTDMSAFEEVPGDYSMLMNFNFQGTDVNGQTIDSTLSIEGSFQKDPFASSVDMTVTGGVGDLGGVDAVAYMETDDILYFYNDVLGCAVLPSQEDTLYNDFVDTGGLLTGVAQRVQPDETVNGVASYVFAITNDNLDTSDPTSSEVHEITSGYLYLAKEGGYVTRIYLEGVGVNEVLTQSPTLEGDIIYQLDFIPAPNGVTITLPEGCQAADSGEAPYPVMDDASEASSFAGFYQYVTNYAFDSVLNFYKSELDALGWSLTDESVYGTTAILAFEMGDEALGVIIAADPNSSAITVNITEQ